MNADSHGRGGRIQIPDALLPKYIVAVSSITNRVGVGSTQGMFDQRTQRALSFVQRACSRSSNAVSQATMMQRCTESIVT